MQIVIISLCVISLMLFGVQLYLETVASTKGNVRAKLESEVAELDMQNVTLREQIYTVESYHTIAARAAQLGFSDGAKSIIYVK